MNALIVNCSRAGNPAPLRLAAWLQQQGMTAQVYPAADLPKDLELLTVDRLYLSILFSWDLPAVLDLAQRALELGIAVEMGGPAAEYNTAAIQDRIGIAPWQGLHPCAAVHLDHPLTTWTSRGCSRQCSFCLVWKIEGPLTELEDWQPAPLVMDNNFLACSPAHQERVLRRLAAAGYHKVDFNQGLDARLYTPAFRRLLDRCGVQLKYWRFAYDHAQDWPAVERALQDLRQAGVDWATIRVYLLYNHHESPEEAVERAEQLINSREHPLACPWPMAYRPLDWMQSGDYVAPGWDLQQLRDFRRYYSRPRIWRTVSAWSEYDRRRPRGVAQGYTPDWNAVAIRVKTEAGWRCEHCGHPHEPEAGYTLTVHHIDGHPQNNTRHNLVALCQRCHLAIQQTGTIQAGQLPLLPDYLPAWTRQGTETE